MSQLLDCPVCGSAKFRELYRYDESRWIPGAIVECAGCRAIWRRLRYPDKPLTEYYDENYATAFETESEEAAKAALGRILDAMVRTIGVNGKTLLDVGCGPGVFLKMAQDAGYTVMGVDVNPTLAAQARARIGGEVFLGELGAMPTDGRKFDVITLLDLIEHVAEPVGLLKQCRALLNPGGHVVVYTPNHRSLIVRIARMLHSATLGRVARPVAEIFNGVHVTFFDRRSLRAVMEKAGLPPTSTTMIKFDPARSQQTGSISGTATRAIEAVSPVVNGQFRMLMIGRKDEANA